ncbi:MAG: phage tail protein [Oscillospiraceae bacterium]|jgi:phage-related tail fiber protein|nr:phage tail protein [Oscillospiraceae bacterium]
MAKYYSIMTNVGLAATANAAVLGKKVNLTTFAVGDGGGAFYSPVPTMTALKGQKWSGTISGYNVSTDSPNLISVTGLIPSDVGGWTIREIGVFDDQERLIAIANYPDTEKISRDDGVSTEIQVGIELLLSNASSVTISVDPTMILATKAEVNAVKEKALTSGKLGSTLLTVADNTLIIPAADSTHDGYMTKEQAVKLAGIDDNANNYIHPTNAGSKHIPAGGAAGQALMWQADGTTKWQQVHYIFDVKLPASGWSSTVPYTQTVNVTGMTADMLPLVGIVQSADVDAAQDERDDFGAIIRVDSGNGTFTATASSKPSKNLNLQIEVNI